MVHIGSSYHVEKWIRFIWAPGIRDGYAMCKDFKGHVLYTSFLFSVHLTIR